MTIAEILSRLDVVYTGDVARAKCPVHADRRGALAIADADNGGILMRCFAGCELPLILQSLGLTYADIAAPRDDDRSAQPYTPPSSARVRTLLREEASRFRSRHHIAPCERLLGDEKNRIRRTIAVRYGVRLDPLPISAIDYAAAGRERDSVWPALIERQWRLAWFVEVDMSAPPLTAVDLRNRLHRRLFDKATDAAIRDWKQMTSE